MFEYTISNQTETTFDVSIKLATIYEAYDFVKARFGCSVDFSALVQQGFKDGVYEITLRLPGDSKEFDGTRNLIETLYAVEIKNFGELIKTVKKLEGFLDALGVNPDLQEVSLDGYENNGSVVTLSVLYIHFTNRPSIIDVRFN